MTVPAELVARWEAAYRRYTELARTARGRRGDVASSETLVAASWEVATAWRDIATTAPLPWWTLAALRAAADAFEHQAHHWHAAMDRNEESWR